VKKHINFIKHAHHKCIWSFHIALFIHTVSSKWTVFPFLLHIVVNGHLHYNPSTQVPHSVGNPVLGTWKKLVLRTAWSHPQLKQLKMTTRQQASWGHHQLDDLANTVISY
jgi:hypothetical protein